MKTFRHTVTAVVASMFGVTMLVSGPASAAPAVVKVFEATARQAPSGVAAPAYVFPEHAELSVSEEVTNGWRRVRLPEGKTAFVRDDEVRLVMPGGGPSIQPLPRTTPAPASSSAIVYVKDLDHLAELVKEDSLVQPKALSLAHRQFAGRAMIYGGAVVGTLVMVAGLTFLAKQDCSIGDSCYRDPNMPAVYGGLAFGTVAALVGYFILPKRSDLLDVLNDWNRRHVDQPFTLDRQPGLPY